MQDAPDPASDPVVTKDIDLDADTEEVWTALTDDDERRLWMGGDTEFDVRPGGRGHITDDDGTRRDVLVHEVEVGRRLTLDWWTDDGVPSHVEFVVVPTERGSRLTVTERPLIPVARADMRASTYAAGVVAHLSRSARV